MKIQHLIPIFFLAAFCTVSAQTNIFSPDANILSLRPKTDIFSSGANVLNIPSYKGTLWLPPHHSGTVRYPDGTPAAGVHVTLYPGVYSSDDDYNYHEAITDKNGHYDISPPKKVSNWFGSHHFLTNCVMARDFGRNFAAVQVYSVIFTNVDLILQPAITLSGFVKNAEGAPVSGAEINLGFDSVGYAPQMHPLFKVDEQGQFSIPTLPQGIEYYIPEIKAKGYGSSHAGVKPEDTRTNHYEFPIFVLMHN